MGNATTFLISQSELLTAPSSSSHPITVSVAGVVVSVLALLVAVVLVTVVVAADVSLSNKKKKPTSDAAYNPTATYNSICTTS